MNRLYLAEKLAQAKKDILELDNLKKLCDGTGRVQQAKEAKKAIENTRKYIKRDVGESTKKEIKKTLGIEIPTKN